MAIDDYIRDRRIELEKSRRAIRILTTGLINIARDAGKRSIESELSAIVADDSLEGFNADFDEMKQVLIEEGY